MDDKKKQSAKPDAGLLEDESVISTKPKQDEAQDGSTKDSDPTM